VLVQDSRPATVYVEAGAAYDLAVSRRIKLEPGQVMNDKILVIIGTAERAKAQAGAMYAVNALKYEWLGDVKLVFFGPAEGLLLDDEDLQVMLRDYQQLAGEAVACRFLADRDGQSEALKELGVQVEYVGPLISGLIKRGYVPMVW
jgi:hypothetical protein